MNIKFRRKMNKLMKYLSKKWYKLMKPLANYLSKRDDRIYKKRKESITSLQAARLIAKDLSNYIAKRSSALEIIIAEYVNTDDTGGSKLSDYRWDMKNKKAVIGFHKFGSKIDFQLMVMYELSQIKGITVTLTDWKPDRWMNIKGFNGLYEIKAED